MDADKEGFLRSDTSLIQTIGRAARNACGEVIMYADKITDSMARAIKETERRRKSSNRIQPEIRIIPQTIKNRLKTICFHLLQATEILKILLQKKWLIWA